MRDRPTVEFKVHFQHAGRGGRKELREGKQEPASPLARVPRIARWMALAIHFDRLISSGEIKTYSALGRLGGVTRARVTQIMNLLQLAPDIQESLLFLTVPEKGRDPICLRELQPIALRLDWGEQRRMWGLLSRRLRNEHEASGEASR